jgi:hypothetical protein
MRRLALALAAATVFAGAVPASAQTVGVEFGFSPGWGYGGYWGGPYAHSDWGGPHPYSYGPSVGYYAGTPAADTYVYADQPRRARRVVRSRVVTSYDPAFDAYAYAPSYSYGGPAVGVAGPGFSVGFGVGPRYPYHPWW